MIDKNTPHIYKAMLGFLQPYIERIHNAPIPPKTREYLNIKRNALSNALCRAEDTASLHLSWLHHHFMLANETRLVDMVAWETLYNEINEELDIPISVLECLELSISGDPMKSLIKTSGVSKPFKGEKTTPAYIALAVEFSEQEDWDIMELYPPMLALELDDIDIINEHMSKVIGADVNVIDELHSGANGLEVWLA